VPAPGAIFCGAGELATGRNCMASIHSGPQRFSGPGWSRSSALIDKACREGTFSQVVAIGVGHDNPNEGARSGGVGICWARPRFDS